ncbi:putative poly-beta-1,6-N-acetyl-D-glucosamine export protein [compost metagenome]
MSIARKMRIDELDLVRAFCVLAVITVHATSYATAQLTESKYFILYNFLNIFSQFGTPTFIAMSGFVLFYNYCDRPLNRELLTGFYRKRLVNILLPYFIFSLFYFCLIQVAKGSPIQFNMIVEFIEKLITGKAYTHLYFVFITVQFYLLFPLILMLFNKYPKLKKWSILIGFAVQWLFILGNKYQFHVESRGSWCFTYFSYYMLGAWMGMYYPSIKAWFVNKRSKQKATWNISTFVMLGIWALWLCSGILLVYVWYEARLFGIYANSLIYDLLLNLLSFTTLPVLIHAASMLLNMKNHSFITRPLNRVGALSFGIYLIHPFFLLLYRQFSPEIGTAWLLHLWYLGGFIVALGCSWIVVGFAARYIRFGWIFFGTLPKTNTKIAVRSNQLNS